MPKRLTGAAAIESMIAALALPSLASAGTRAGDRTFPQTFPVASKLCDEVAAGKRKHLVSVAAAVGAPVGVRGGIRRCRPSRTREARRYSVRAHMAKRIVTLPGDGIGPEIMAAALEVLRAVGDFELEEHVFGGASIDAHGTALA